MTGKPTKQQVEDVLKAARLSAVFFHSSQEFAPGAAERVADILVGAGLVDGPLRYDRIDGAPKEIGPRITPPEE